MEFSSLPAASVDKWDWQLDGACRRADPRLFFHPDAERGPARQERDAAALRICATCPVIRRCRDHGLSVREPHGVWGGLTEEDRDEIYRANRKGSKRVSRLAEVRRAQ